MKGIGYFQNLGNLLRNCLEIFWEFFRRIFLEEFFWRIFWGGFFERIFWKEFFKRNFLGGFYERIFWEDFWEEFFVRNYLVEINKKLMFFQDFWVILSQWRRRKENFNP